MKSPHNEQLIIMLLIWLHSSLVVGLPISTEPSNGQNQFEADKPSSPETQTTTTAQIPQPEACIDNPNNANPSTTTSSVSPTSQSRDETCRRQCFNIVTNASKLMSEHQYYKEKVMMLVRKKNYNLGRSLGVQNRSLGNLGSDQQIIVSRLRVTRTAEDIEAKLKDLTNKRDKKQKDACRVLWEVQTCLSDASRTCIGSLAYHTNEVITTQWFEKLRCPSKNRPDMKPFTNLHRSWKDHDQQISHPVARPDTSREEGQKRLEALLGTKVVLLSPKYDQRTPIMTRTRTIGQSSATNLSPTSRLTGLLPVGIVAMSLMLFIIILVLFFKEPYYKEDEDSIEKQ